MNKLFLILMIGMLFLLSGCGDIIRESSKTVVGTIVSIQKTERDICPQKATVFISPSGTNQSSSEMIYLHFEDFDSKKDETVRPFLNKKVIITVDTLVKRSGNPFVVLCDESKIVEIKELEKSHD